MPVFINEVSAEVPEPIVPKVQSEAPEQPLAVTQPEREFLTTLTIIEERRERMKFD